MEDERQRKPTGTRAVVKSSSNQSVTQKLDLVFLDGPFSAQGKSDFTEYTNFEQGFLSCAIAQLDPYPACCEGVAIAMVDKIKFLILMSGGKFGGKMFGMAELATNAYSKPIECPSLHVIGEKDFAKRECIALLEAFEDPVVIHQVERSLVISFKRYLTSISCALMHIVPKLDGKNLETMFAFIDTIPTVRLRLESL